MPIFAEPTLLPGLKSEINPGAGLNVRNFSVASQALVATVAAYIAGTQLLVPSSGLKVGSKIRFVVDATKTAAGSAASTFAIVFGTAGDVTDTARVSFVKSAGTGAIDEGKFVIEAIVRSVSTTGVVVGVFTGTHRLAVTGHSVLPMQETTISGTFDNSGQELFIGLVITTGASDVVTIQYAEGELSGV